ncbi:MAG: exodeoxyribonuclease VII small subunit [Bdellovibrionales bacterium]|nr:exodeoxyribonuclease VII small subunit [Bdellovibrionales bacterium]
MSKQKSFEIAIKELETIVHKLESDELPLEESIALFDEGTKLSKICSEQLDQAQEKIEKLISQLKN